MFRPHSGVSKTRPFIIIAGLAVAFLAIGNSWARAQYTPEHPQVRQVIREGIEFLEGAIDSESRPGGKALAGMAIAKATADPENETVLKCVKAVREAYRELAAAEEYNDEGMYNIGLCTLFLITVDPVQYRRDIEGWLRLLERYQKPHGGWGYYSRESGDTSMTQYGALACWEAHNSKIPVSQRMANGALSWLLRTQDPSGAFGYQGRLASSYDKPVQQMEIRLTMATAGMGSLYVMSDLFGLNGQKKKDNGLPPALKEIGGEEEKGEVRAHMKGSVARDFVQRAKQRGNAWFASHYAIETNQWQFYYLYALERYQSFRELAENTSDPSPQWYNDGVKFLFGRRRNGSWTESGGDIVDTSFALLFLMRSTKKSIQKAQDFGAGVMLGGRGIPKDTDKLTLRNGEVVSLEEVRLTKQMIDAVGTPESIDNAEMLDAISKLPPKESRLLATEHAEKLRALLKSDSPQAKMTVAKTLGQSGDLSNVPTLILLLADANRNVAIEARDALRRLSRRFDGFGLSEKFVEVERDNAIKAWKAWYRRVEPDVEFE